MSINPSRGGGKPGGFAEVMYLLLVGVCVGFAAGSVVASIAILQSLP